MSTLLSVKQLNVRFNMERGAQFHAVKDISFDVPQQQSVALVGESGSGKSVSAMSIVGLLPPNARLTGQVLFNGTDLLTNRDLVPRLRGKEMAVVFQEPMTSLNPVFTVGDQIMEPLRLHMGMSAAQAKTRVVELLAEVGIPQPQSRVRSYPHELSGGQQQRVMIAMALACEPKLLIADEPTTALDVTVQRQILDLLAQLRQKHKMSLLFITHDLGLVGEIADQVVVMQHGEVRESGSTAQVFANPQHPYTKALIACRPTLETRAKRLPIVSDFTGDEERARKAANPEQRTADAKGVKPEDVAVLTVQGLNKVFSLREGLFKRKELVAAQDVNFKLYKGRTLGLVGESGSGKTTVGLMLLRLHEATSGQVLFDGQNLAQLNNKQWQPYRKHVQIIFQNPYASLNPRFTIEQVLLEPMRIHNIGANDQERFKMAQGLLDRVSLPHTALAKYPHEFSGGQRQRIAIARALTLKPQVLVLDEAVSALDVSVQAQVLNLLQDLQDEFGLAYLFISHDLAVVKYISDEILVMRHGQVIEQGSSEQIYASPQQEYTRNLLNAIPKIRSFA